MPLEFYTIDAFTESPFGGNPAAVVPLNENLPEEKLQIIATEFNLSDTAYIRPTNPSDSFQTGVKFSIRWFTPTNEVPLCGHATLAAAYVLFFCLDNQSSIIEFESPSGKLIVKRDDQQITLDFPSNSPTPLSDLESQSLSPIVDLVSENIAVQDAALARNLKILLVRLNDKCTRHDLENLVINPGRLNSLHDGTLVNGLIVTLVGGQSGAKNTDPNLNEYHFVSRYFAPWYGVPEDPVTGSAHTVLGPYWSKVFGIKTLKGRQCSRRGGDLTVSIRDDGRVDISGRAVLVMKGSLHV